MAAIEEVGTLTIAVIVAGKTMIAVMDAGAVVEETMTVGMDAGAVVEEEEETVGVTAAGVVVPEAEEIGVVGPRETGGGETNTKTITNRTTKTLWP